MANKWYKPLAPEEFETLKQIFEQERPQFAADPRAIHEKILELDADVARLLGEKPDDVAPAVSILLQGRNFLARYIDLPEVRFPDLQSPTPELPDPLLEKYVALYANEPLVVKAFVHVLTTLPLGKPLRYEQYPVGIKELLGDILQGKIAGIIALSSRPDESIEGRLRHDLKDKPGFNYHSAQTYVLPYCVDFPAPLPLGPALQCMYEMQEGTYEPAKDVTEFSLQAALPSLIAHAYLPSHPIKVVIVDDVEKEMEGMKVILEAWNLRVLTIIQKDGRLPEIPFDAHIVLLDEGMDNLTGTDVARKLNEYSYRFKGVIASTTTGEKPEFTPWHFAAKGRIMTERKAAEEFVKFMNMLLRQT